MVVKHPIASGRPLFTLPDGRFYGALTERLIPNDIIPSDPMRNAVTKTSEHIAELKELLSQGWGPNTEAAFQAGIDALSATPAPEPQLEVAAEPDRQAGPGFECTWDDGEYAIRWDNGRWLHAFASGKVVVTDVSSSKVQSHTVESLLNPPSVVEEAVKVEREACAEAGAHAAEQFVRYNVGSTWSDEAGNAVEAAIRARSATP